MLATGSYIIKYRITGIFEAITVSEGDVQEAFDKARELFANVKPIRKGVRFNHKDMTVSLYIKVLNPISIGHWNEEFRESLLSLFPTYQKFLQRLNVRYITTREIKEEKAIEQQQQPGFFGSMVSDLGSYLMWGAIGVTAVYAFLQRGKE